MVTVSDSVSRGDAEDRGGPLAAGLLAEGGWEVVEQRVVPDDAAAIAAAVAACCDSGATLVVTTGGTGIAPRDVTPEAIRSVIHTEVPGIAEAMRAVTFGVLPQGMLSRQVAGARGRSLVVALPGSTGGVREGLAAVLPALGHAVDLLHGETAHGPRGGPAAAAPT